MGPASQALYRRTVDEFIAAHQGQRPPAVVFHNGVFGMFEDPRFESGTRTFMAELKRMTDAGIRVYVGGGEGALRGEVWAERLGYLLFHRRRHRAERPGQRAGALPGGPENGGRDHGAAAARGKRPGRVRWPCAFWRRNGVRSGLGISGQNSGPDRTALPANPRHSCTHDGIGDIAVTTRLEMMGVVGDLGCPVKQRPATRR